MEEMDRPTRNKKTVNYSDFIDNDDDEDFATAKAPPNKKAKEPRLNELVGSTAKARKDRMPLDEKIFKRELETALIMSQLHSTQRPDERSAPGADVPPVLNHFSVDGHCLDDDKLSRQTTEDAPPVLSNCSVDVASLGLDQISSDQTPLSSVCSKRKSQKTTEQQIHDPKEEDEDYKPQNTPESESEFSDANQSEEEEYVIRKKGKRTIKKDNKTSPKILKKEKKPTKPKLQSKAKNSLSSPGVRSPSASRPLSTLSRTPSTPPMNKSSLHTSPAGGRMTKWTPPGLVGGSPSSCQSPSLRSPGLGLRLGLSRLARVKPLHPNAVAL